ncbi:Cadmium, zinc and cobalt-transporting ATPase [Slackia heliotrinireducens]|uniref:Heavy metal-translocating P-type ATPase, Cd/Co/Hg/Pb/Zn-transporting n=1 Tax=Slackia heliotrinireducens (strain ATCC 29202 / DSM 20476 / NCTC 11029 / RHS 1) TaxID=471855 RepID=C7N3R2_SLAHD|nr:heavy metal translocating P-type ATPase [Slackia heliotrinireducens]ACV21653.1 heavy metal-translocating P-type ATPase, Cd/Co/Hg/Pb/Zn-transporting [Slackia heliotrinireducens DSM 20476]VEG99246.1 Cadmium, zinc and cobalt-transporting ATPase [Slackia heliotrinireducens]
MASSLTKKQRKTRNRIAVALGIFLLLEIASHLGAFDGPYGLWIEFACFLVPYLIAGYDVLAKAWHGIVHRQPFDENLLMSIATIGAFALVFFPEAEPHMAEGAAVMLFYQVGELFESYAVGKTRKSIAAMMDIAPDYANIAGPDGTLEQVDPYDIKPGDEIVIKPGERVPLDGVVVSGKSQLDTSALTGESVPCVVEEGVEVVSGCINMTGLITVRVSRPFGESTVSRILELVENASEKKARTENFITRFARYYTPIVVGLAVLIAVVSPLAFGSNWSDSVRSALIFLVVSCPCALVISVPLSFFGGIGAASRAGILVKGSSYLETLASTEAIAFDKTGTLTNGTFNVVAVHAEENVDPDLLLSYAAHAEAYSDHPIAVSVKAKYSGTIDAEQIAEVQELSGQGVSAQVKQHTVLVGNDKLMAAQGIPFHSCRLVGTILHVAVDGEYVGHIVIADVLKDDAAQAIRGLHEAGVKKAVMLTGDCEEVAQAVAKDLGIDEVYAQLMPQDKVSKVEELLEATSERGKLAFVGDGINDAPVLMRSDIGIAMGGMGSDAAIEAADVVLMDDKPSSIALAIRIARKTMRIVWQNIIFAIGVKVVIMILALPFIGIATMWLAVFGDVGVACLAILNAMRALRIAK